MEIPYFLPVVSSFSYSLPLPSSHLQWLAYRRRPRPPARINASSSHRAVAFIPFSFLPVINCAEGTSRRMACPKLCEVQLVLFHGGNHPLYEYALNIPGPQPSQAGIYQVC